MERVISYYKMEDVEYPEKLKQIPDPPKGIYCIGNMPDPKKPTIAMVGARMCTAYGRGQAKAFARELSSRGIQIVSGLAKGIDGHSHRGALVGGTPTFAVLACGLDYCYPPEHMNLMEEILEEGGGILSEYPICTPPLRPYFPQRNRIISGLSDLTLIIEAKEKSGSLITADCALEQGKSVFALPGRVGDITSVGCNKLIAQGAGIAISVECILQELHIDNVVTGKEAEKISLASDRKLVYSGLNLSPKTMLQLADELKLPISQLSEILLELELSGLIEQVGPNQFVRRI